MLLDTLYTVSTGVSHETEEKIGSLQSQIEANQRLMGMLLGYSICTKITVVCRHSINDKSVICSILFSCVSGDMEKSWEQKLAEAVARAQQQKQADSNSLVTRLVKSGIAPAQSLATSKYMF